jgi:RNA polymerase I-specific transcription initiation factor RRN3
MENNKRADYAPMPITSTGSQNGITSATKGQTVRPTILIGSVNPELSTFFPFDPYRLQKSGSYINNIYRDWSMVALDDEDEDDDEDESEEEDEEPVDELKDHLGGYLSVPKRSSPPDDEEEEGLGESLDKMSISPAHHLLHARTMSR